MERRRVTFEESCARVCALRLVECGGPTASGLDGYVCEKCAEFLVAQTSDSARLAAVPCGYCGRFPTYTAARGQPICGHCAAGGLAAARDWYQSYGQLPTK
jgi:hypothetical protein